MSFAILGLGTAVPPNPMSQEKATELAQRVVCQNDQQRRLISALYRRAGVERRHTAVPCEIALDWIPDGASHSQTDPPEPTLGPTTAVRMEHYSLHAPPLAQAAAEQALADARLAPRDVTHLVTVSCTGFDAPGVDVAIVQRLGLRPTTERVHVGFMGCHGAINGLRVARGLAASDPAARVLLCAVELCSLHYRFRWDPERIVANAIFADGAAALVVGGSEYPAASGDWSLQATGSCLIPQSEGAMRWRIGDHGFEMTLDARVPELIKQYLRDWLGGWLESHGLSVESIPTWAVHPGGPRILDAVEESLGLSRDATAISREVLASHGNMSSPTVLFILEKLRRAGAPRPCVALGFGPGLFAEAALFV